MARSETGPSALDPKPASRIWDACAGRAEPHLLGGTLYRLVESQAQSATTRLVDGDLGKQAVLEKLLEPSKPPRPPGTERLDYLLATPWRYPPLRYGSRFGRRSEPSLFYGGCGVAPTLAESAYYRWVFWFDMREPPPARLASQHTLYQARYRSDRGLRLYEPPFDDHLPVLTDRADYRESQALGSALRAAGVEAFEYRSARDPERGNNVALLSPDALRSRRAEKLQPWRCTTTATEVTFSYGGRPSDVRRFALTDFLLDGRFPRPA